MTEDQQPPNALNGLGEDLDGSLKPNGVSPDGEVATGRRKRGTTRIESQGPLRVTAGDLPDPEQMATRRQTLLSMGGGKDGRAILMAGVLFIGVAAVFGAIMLLGKREAPQISRPQITTGAKIGLSAEEEIRAFTQSSSQKILDTKKEVAEIREEIKGIRNDFSKLTDSNEKLMTRVLEEFKRAADDKLRSLDTVAKAQTANFLKAGSPEDQRSKSILDEFRLALTNLTMTPAEARVKAAEMLRLAGYQESDITNLLAQTAQTAGRIQVGNIQEVAASESDRAKVPKDLAPFLEEGHRVTHAMATFDQVLTEERVKERLSKFLSGKVSRGRTLEKADVAAFYECSRVRRENLPEEMQDVLPFLIAQREVLGIRRDDIDATCAMIWANRNRYGGQPTAGQLLSLTQYVSRSVPAASSAPGDVKVKFQALTPDQSSSLDRVLDQGLESSWNLGRQDETGLASSSMKVINNYLEVARAALDPQAKIELTQRHVKDFLSRKRGGGDVASVQARSSVAVPALSPVSISPAPSSVTEVSREPMVSMGRLKLTKRQFQQAVYLMVPEVLRTAGIKPGDLEGVAASIVLWEQSRRIADQVFPEVSGTSDGAGDAVRLVMPALVEIARAGAGLVEVKLGFADQRTKPDDRRAMVALLASKVGPVIHDGRLAAEVVAKLDAAFKSDTPPDLQQTIKAMRSAYVLEK